MSDRSVAIDRAHLLAAARPDAVRLVFEDATSAVLSKVRARMTLRLRPSALPFRPAKLHHVIAVGIVRDAVGDGRRDFFREAQRALRDQGSLVYGEPDADGLFAKDHLFLREMGMVPAPVDTIPELSHVPWRLLVAFKPLGDSKASAERGHETH